MIIDTHAHYDDSAFDENRDELLWGLKEKNVEYVVNVGADIKTSQNALELAEKFPFVYAAIGVHPDCVGNLTKEDEKFLVDNVKNEKVVAVGEIGLDYYWDKADHDTQKFWFEKQIQIALDNGLPINVHSREAAADTLEIIKSIYGSANNRTNVNTNLNANSNTNGNTNPNINSKPLLPGIIHCYSYSVEHAREYVKMGFMLGIGGVVTFKNSKKLKEVVAEISIENLVLETDSPYLCPSPNRGKRNDSSYLSYVVEEIANIKQMGVEEVERITTENAKRVYFKMCNNCVG